MLIANQQILQNFANMHAGSASVINKWIGGNKYRLVAVVLFIGNVMTLRFIGTHAEYDKIDCATI